MTKGTYRITTEEHAPSFTATHKELRNYIQLLHSKILMGNTILGSYELKIRNMKRQMKDLEDEKYPPMDKIKDLPVVADSDLPFLISEDS